MIMVHGRAYAPEYLIDSGWLWLGLLPILGWLVWQLHAQQRLTWLRFGGGVALALYVYELLRLTLFPLMIFSSTNPIRHVKWGQQVMTNFNPVTIFQSSRLELWGNLLLLLPLGILVGVLWGQTRLGPSLVVGVGTTGFIEVSQLVLSFFYLGNRTCDINDLILNTAGYCLGFGIWRLAQTIWQSKMSEFQLFE